MSSFLKKVKSAIASLITLPFIGECIRNRPGNHLNKHGLKFDLSNKIISARDIGFFYWGLYEKAEIKFINKYLSNHMAETVVELGGSLGIVSCVIASRLLPGQQLTVVEANPNLPPIIEKNLQLNGFENVRVINAAVPLTNAKEVFFEVNTSSLLGRIVPGRTPHSVVVPCRKLSDIVEDGKEFILVCDIEGAEVGLLENDASVLSRAKLIIIETHNAVYNGNKITYIEIKKRFLDKGFELLDEHGAVYVLKKRDHVS